MATIVRIDDQRRIIVNGDPTAAGAINAVCNPGDVVYREDTGVTYFMTDAGLVAGTSLDESPVFTSVTTGTLSATTSATVTSASASALAVGLAGATNPVLKVDASTASQATGVSITGAAATARVAIAAISSETNEGLDINAKGSGTVRIGNSSTGSVSVGAGLVVGNAAATTLTGGAGNMTITAGTGNSRTLTLQGTSSGGVATTFATGSDTAFNIPTGVQLQTVGVRVGYNVSAYAAGTPYALTNTAAAIDVGTTDPAIVIANAGTYLIMGQVNLAYNGATVVAETATVKVRRTNNTAADLSAVVVIDLPAATTLTHMYGTVVIPPFVYTTSATDDAVTLFANVSAALGAGTIDATAIGTSIIAIRLY